MASVSPLFSSPKLAMALTERTQLLESTKWFQDLEYKQVEKLASYMDAYVVQSNVILVREGTKESYMGVVVKGKVAVKKKDTDGKSKVISTLGSGKTFGEMSLIDDLPRSADVEVTEALTLLVLTKERFDLLIVEAPPLAAALLLKLAKLLSARLRQTSGKLAEFLE